VNDDELRRLLEHGNPDQVADRLLALDEQQRRALAPQVRAAARRLTGAAVDGTKAPEAAAEADALETVANSEAVAETEVPEAVAGAGAGQPSGTGPGLSRPGEPGDGRSSVPVWVREHGERAIERREAALRVAGAACLPRAAEVVAWQRAGRFRRAMSARTVAAIVRVAGADGRPAMAEVAALLASRLRTADDGWELAATMLRAAGLTPPTSEAMVRGWIRSLSAGPPWQLANRLGGDPWLETMLPPLFEMPRAAGDLDDEWAGALVRLAGNDRIDRGQLTRLVLRRLAAPERTGLPPVVTTYRLLDLGVDELVEHRAALFALLDAQQVSVADIGLRALRALDEAGLMDADGVAAAGRVVLRRSGKKLGRAQLAWLEKAVSRHPESAGMLLEVVAGALTHDDADLVEQARRVLTHLQAEQLISAGKAGKVADTARKGEETATADETARPKVADSADRPVKAEGPARAVRPAMAEGQGMTEGQELADGPAMADGAATAPRAATTERPTMADGPAMAGRPAMADGPAMIRMPPPLASVAELDVAIGRYRLDPWEPVELERLLAGLVSLTYSCRESVRAILADAGPFLETPAPGTGPLSALLRERITEVAGLLTGGGPPLLLATPTTRDGHLDPARLLFRVAEAERDGWQPGPYDLSQALLRLPAQPDPAVGAAADRLRSPAGRRFAAWLRDGGLPEPIVTIQPAPDRRVAVFPPLAVADLTVPPGLFDPPADRGPAADPGPVADPGPAADARCWPLILPSHREIVAAHAAAMPELLPALAHASGPPGPALALALAYGLGSPERDAAVDAVLHLARTGDLHADLVGRELSLLLEAGALDPAAVAGALEAIDRAGAAQVVWALTHAVVPALLRTGRAARVSV
jgi:hypothetical protein